MQFRTVPGTALRVSAIGFGCGGNAGLMVRGSAADQARTVAHALDRGITYFDTAPDYGDGAAEHALGRALPRSADAVVTTKVEIRRQDLADVAGHVVRSTRDSLRRLRRPRVEVLMIHNGPVATPPPMLDGDYHTLWLDHFLRPGGALDGLRQLLDAGDIGQAGFVCRGADGPEVRALLDTGAFRMVNLPYNLLNQSAGNGPGQPDLAGALDAARQRNCGAAVFSPLAGGFLAGPAPAHALARPRDPASRKAAAAQHFTALARACGDSLSGTAYRFVLSHPGVTTVLCGFSDPDQVDDAVAAASRPPLTPDLLALAAPEDVPA